MKTVLIVEDDPDLRQMFRTALSFAGYHVVQVSNGLDALRQLEGTDVDCVVLDLGLPVLSGRVVLQEIAVQAHTRAVPVVIVVTGERGPHDLPHATCVLTKPLSPDQLLNIVRRCLAAPRSAEDA